MSKPTPESAPTPTPTPADEAGITGDASPPGCLAVAAACVGAAIGAGVVFGSLDLLPFVFVGALLLASAHVVLALPIHFALASRFRISFWMILLAATLIGALPASAVAILLGGWRNLGEVAASFGFCGACGGLGFWLVVRSGPQ